MRVQARSPSAASASNSRSCPLPGWTAATQRNDVPPAALRCGGAGWTGSTPGSATSTGRTPYQPRRRSRDQALVVTTAAAEPSTCASPASGPIGMCRSTTRRKPGGVAREHRSRARRDEPVDQDQRALGDPDQERVELVEVGGFGRRPAARDRQLEHRPATVGQPVEDPTVVAVAAAGTSGVVDAGGKHGVQRNRHGALS